MNLATPTPVILGLDPRIYATAATVDPRVKPEDDEGEDVGGEVFATLSAVCLPEPP